MVRVIRVADIAIQKCMVPAAITARRASMSTATTRTPATGAVRGPMARGVTIRQRASTVMAPERASASGVVRSRRGPDATTAPRAATRSEGRWTADFIARPRGR